METLRKRIGSANYLLAFEAAARHLNFTRAASELNVSQPAVSSQIRNLEDRIGRRLFHRKGHALSLTHDGLRLYEVVRKSFVDISGTIEELRRDHDLDAVNIYGHFVTVSRWLLDLLGPLEKAFPELDIKIRYQDDMQQIQSGDGDLNIVFGRGEWAGFEKFKLYDEVMFPVCTPAYAKRHGPFENLGDVSRCQLLQLEEFRSPWNSWHHWFRKFSGDRATEPPMKIRVFNNYEVLVKAVLKGYGVGLCWKYLFADQVAKGELVAPIDLAIRSEFGDFIAFSAQSNRMPELKSVADWLQRSARERISDWDSVGPTNIVDV